MLLYVQAVLGLWTLLSPWILGYKDIQLALLSNVIAGLIIFLSAIWLIFEQKNKNN